MSEHKSAVKSLKIGLPAQERGRSPADIRRLDRLLNRLARTDLSPKQCEAAMRELHALENAPLEVADKAWRERAEAETAALAEIRGEVVDRSPKRATRVNSRDALLSICGAGHITAAQFETGRKVRDFYEARSEGVGSQLGAINSVGGAHNNDRFVFNGLQRAQRLQRIATIERAMLAGFFRNDAGQTVEVRCFARFRSEGIETHNALNLLKGICGENRSMSSFGEGRIFERNVKALRLALDVAHEVIGGALFQKASDTGKPGMISLGEMNARAPE